MDGASLATQRLSGYQQHGGGRVDGWRSVGALMGKERDCRQLPLATPHSSVCTINLPSYTSISNLKLELKQIKAIKQTS